jgi:hypothetical protein
VSALPLPGVTPDRTLEQVSAELARQVERRVAQGKCGCGCGRDLPLRPGRQKYLDGHRQRWHKRRVRTLAEAAGVVAGLSLKSVRTASPTGERSGYGPARPTAPQARKSRGSRSGPQLSYAKTVDVLTRYLIDEAGWKGHERMVRAEVRAVLAPALSETQRARLAARNGNGKAEG